jgi:hypothetical protein
MLSMKIVFFTAPVHTTKSHHGTPAGLTLCGSHAFVGTSSDGRVIENGEEGIIEIKCSFSVKENYVNNMEIEDILSMNGSSFCLQYTSKCMRVTKC